MIQIDGEIYHVIGLEESIYWKWVYSPSSVQFSSVAQSCPAPCDPMDCSIPGFPVHHKLPVFTQTHVHWVSDASNHLMFCCPLLLLPSILPTIGVFSNESVLHVRWWKYWSFSFSVSPSDEYSGLISFRMDWLDLLAVQETLKSPLQYHSSKASIIQHSAFFIVQLSHPYMTTGKKHCFDLMEFVSKIRSLHCDKLSRLVITFLLRNKRLLISWLQSPSAVILEPSKTKSVTVSTVSWSICHEVMGPDAMILVFWMLSFKPIFFTLLFHFLFFPPSFIFIERLFSSSSLSAIRVVSSAYLRLLIFFPAILISACTSFSPAFLMMYFAYKLNKQGDNIHPSHTPFPILNQSVVLHPVLTVVSWPTYRFFWTKVRWSGILIFFRILHSLLWSTQAKALA